MAPSQINQNPIQGEFFTSVSDLPERVVREAIQNSLDARRGSETVRVRFGLSGSEGALPADAAIGWVRGLEPHIAAIALAESQKRSENEQDALYQAHELLAGPMEYLVVEDFGTTGLIGNIEANSEYEKENAFWGFFRSIGISPKGADAGGSWGLGKWVFPDASRINAFIGLTRREDETRSLVMGQAMLETHTIGHPVGAAKYPPYGFFAASSDQPDSEWLPTPMDSMNTSHAIARLVENFGLQRGDHPGLSVVVPHPKDELSVEAITRAVVVQWFLPVLRGDLEVTVEAPNDRWVIDRNSITDVLERLDQDVQAGEQRRDDETKASLRGLLKLAGWALQLEESLEIPEVVPWGSSSDVITEEVRAAFDRGDQLAFRVPIRVRQQGQALRDAAQSTFRVFLERDEELKEGHDYFVRGHLRIPQMDHVKRFPVRALVIVEANTALAHLLRDAEGPAHTKWDPRADRLKQQWSGGYQRVQDVRHSALLLVQQLSRRPEGRQLDVLARFFPDTLPDPTKRSRATSAGAGDSPARPAIPPLRRSPLEITQRPRGFIVRRHADERGAESGSLAQSRWLIRFAYDVARRNAFNEFEKGRADGAPDFDLNTDKLSITREHATYTIVGPNALDVIDEASDFSLTVSGFDGRDVLVEAKQLEWSAELSGAAAG